MREEFDETLSEKMASAIRTSMLLVEFQNLVFEHRGSGEIRYEAVKDKVLSVTGNRITQSTPVPTDIGEAASAGDGGGHWLLTRTRRLMSWENEDNVVIGAAG